MRSATGAERKNRRTSREQPLPKWSDGSADRRTGGRPEVAAGIDVFGSERRQFAESTGRTGLSRTNLQVSTSNCNCELSRPVFFESLDRLLHHRSLFHESHRFLL